MALKWFESFDLSTALGDFTASSSARRWSNNNGSSAYSISAGNGRNSTASLRMATWNSAGATRAAGASYATGVVGFAFRFSALPSSASAPIVVFRDSAITHITVGLDTSGNLLVYRADLAGTQLASVASGMSVNTYYYLEVKVTIDDAAGVVVVKRNGTTLVNLSSQDTRNAGNASFDSVVLGNGAVSSSGAANLDFDDVYFLDTSGSLNTDFLGDCRVILLRPTGNGTTNNFTPSAGSNFQNVDDTAPDGTTTRNSTSTANHIDLYNFDALGVSLDPRGVQVTGWQAREGGSLGQTINYQFIARPGSTNNVSATYAVASAYAFHLWETNPDTTSQWAISEIDASEFGVKFVAGGTAPGMYITQHAIEVLLGPLSGDATFSAVVMTASAALLAVSAMGGSGVISGAVMRASAAMPTAVLTTTAPGTINAAVMAATARMPAGLLKVGGTMVADTPMRAVARMPAATVGQATNVPFETAVMTATAQMPAGTFARGGRLTAGVMPAQARMPTASLQMAGLAPSFGEPSDVGVTITPHTGAPVTLSSALVRPRWSSQMQGGDADLSFGRLDYPDYTRLAHPGALCSVADLQGIFHLTRMDEPGADFAPSVSLLDHLARGFASSAQDQTYTVETIFTAGTTLEAIFRSTRAAKCPDLGGDLIEYLGRALTQDTPDFIGNTPQDIWTALLRFGNSISQPFYWTVGAHPTLGGSTAYLQVRPRPTAPTLFVALTDLDHAPIRWPLSRVFNKISIRYKAGDTTAVYTAEDSDSQSDFPTGVGVVREFYRDFSGSLDNATDAAYVANTLLTQLKTLRPTGSNLQITWPNRITDEFGLPLPLWRTTHLVGQVIRITGLTVDGPYETDQLIVAAAWDDASRRLTLQTEQVASQLELWDRLLDQLRDDLTEEVAQAIEDAIEDLEGGTFTAPPDQPGGAPTIDPEGHIDPGVIPDEIKELVIAQQLGSTHPDADPLEAGEFATLPTISASVTIWELHCYPAGSITVVMRNGWPGGAVIATGQVSGGSLASGNIAPTDLAPDGRVQTEVTVADGTVRYVMMGLRGEKG